MDGPKKSSSSFIPITPDQNKGGHDVKTKRKLDEIHPSSKIVPEQDVDHFIEKKAELFTPPSRHVSQGSPQVQ